MLVILLNESRQRVQFAKLDQISLQNLVENLCIFHKMIRKSNEFFACSRPFSSQWLKIFVNQFSLTNSNAEVIKVNLHQVPNPPNLPKQIYLQINTFISYSLKRSKRNFKINKSPSTLLTKYQFIWGQATDFASIFMCPILHNIVLWFSQYFYWF